MMSLLLSSVSASAVIAGGGGYPTYAEFQYVDSFDYIVNSLNELEFTVNIPSTGYYVICAYGQWGGSGNSDSGVDNFTSDTAVLFEELAAYEDGYEAIVWAKARYSSIGDHVIKLDTGGGTNFRCGITVWKLKAANPNGLSVGMEHDADPLVSTVTPPANGAIVAQTLNNSGTPTFTGLDTADVPIYDAETSFYFGSFSQAGTPGTALTLTNDPGGGSGSRNMTSWVYTSYLSEADALGFYLDKSIAYALTGRGASSLAIQKSVTYAVFGNQTSRLALQNAATYLIVET